MDEFRTSGTWEQERLYVMRTIEELKDSARRQSEDAAVVKQGKLAKAEKDIQVAYERIRNLEGKKTTLGMKVWILTGILAAGATTLFEILKLWTHK